MAEKLSWEEIKRQYPNEWVSIVDFEEDKSGFVVNGIVIYHNPQKSIYSKELSKILEETKHNEVASLYTGRHKPLRAWEVSSRERVS